MSPSVSKMPCPPVSGAAVPVLSPGVSPVTFFRSALLALTTAALLLVTAARAQEKVTYQDHLLPVIESHCGKCHNPDKKKGDLDMTSYGALMSGGASGKIVLSGYPDGSKLHKVINHLDEPNMPPNKPKLPDKELAVFKKWIAGGLLESSGSKAIAANNPTMDLTLSAASIGRPSGPPPMPGDLLLEPPVLTARPSAITGLAGSPWSPLLAVAGQKQVLLYQSETLELLGVLPFPEGQPCDLKFSPSGKLLVAGGGHAGKSGRVLVWNVTTGDRVMTIGDEYDSVLASDISADQTRLALGGPGRLVKIYSTKTGELEHKIKKHTDWVTALAFSPDGKLLASGDRNGGLFVWEAASGEELHNTAGHKSAVTAIAWRGDSKVFVTVSEDGALKIWETQEGRQAGTWIAHVGGALAVDYAHDGRLVTCGRDNQVIAWDGTGKKLRSFDFTNELPFRVAFNHDGTRVFAADWTGRLTVWSAESIKVLDEISANPPTLAAQLVAAEQRVAELQKVVAKPVPVNSPADLARAKAEKNKARAEMDKATAELKQLQASVVAKEAEVEKLKADLAKNTTDELQAKVTAQREVRNKLRLQVTNATEVLAIKTRRANELERAVPVKAIDPAAELAAARATVARLKAAQFYSGVYRVRESIAVKKREQEKLSASDEKKDKKAAEKLAKDIASEQKQLEKLTAEYEKIKSSTAPPVRQSKL